MYFQLDNVLFTSLFIFASVVFWYIRKFIWPYRKFPSIYFNKRVLMDILQGKYQIVKYFETHSLNILISLCKIFEKEGLCFFYYMEPSVFVFNEDYAKILLNESALLDRPRQYKVLLETVGDGLLSHQGIIWKKRRKMMNPAFNFRLLKNYVTTFNRYARHAVDRFSMFVDQPTSDVLKIMKTTFMKAVCEIVIGKEMNGLEYEKKISEVLVSQSRLGAHVIYRSFRPWRCFKALEFLHETGRNHQKDYEVYESFMKYLIEEAMKDNPSDDEDLRSDDFEGKSLFHILLRHHLNDPKSFTMENLFYEILIIIVAGHDSLTHTMHWCLIMLSLHPEIQQKAFEEVESVLGGEDRDITYEDINNLSYLDCIIKETLRLYPAAPYFARLSTEDIQCGKYKIPKSTCIGFVVPLLHRNPDIYPNPDKFNPDRFHNRTLEHPWAYVPFAEGIRSCIGKHFAMLELKVYLAHILRNFKLSLEEKDKEIRVKWSLVLEAVDPVLFLLTKR